MDRMLAGVSTRKYVVVGEPVGEDVEQEARATSKSHGVGAVRRADPHLRSRELMGRRLDDVRLAVMMLDGLEIADRTHVVALGISTEGVKIPLGLWEGSTENATLVSMLLADLVDRGLDPEQAILFVIDGGKALRAGSTTCSASTRWCIAVTGTKRATVSDLLPERDRPMILARIRGAWALTRPAPRRGAARAARLRARPDLAGRRRVAARGDARHADADAARDRRPARKDAVLDEPVRVDDRDRSLHAAQRETLAGRRHAQALDRCRDARRRAAVPRIIGYRDLAKLVIAIERHTHPRCREANRDRQETRETVTV